MYSIQERLSIESEPIDGALWQWACMMRSAIPGIVKSFDPVKQTCVVQVAIKEWILVPPPPDEITNSNPGTIQNVVVAEAIRALEDVPIIMMRVSGWSITFPIVAGTECLLIFADTCIDGWWQNSGVQTSWDHRRHDLSDAFALFGPWSQPHKLSNYSTTSVQIRSDDQTIMVELTSSAINIISPSVNVSGNLSVGSGASGTFTDSTGQIVTVQDGIIISIV